MKLPLATPLALFAGLLGGALSRYIAPLPVFAQVPSTQREIRAQSFVLTDATGATIGVFTSAPQRFDPQKRMIILLGQDGNKIWSAGDSPLLPLSQR